MTAQSIATDAIFADPNMAMDAVYRSGGFAPDWPVRVILRQPDADIRFNDARVTTASVIIHVRTGEVDCPASGDVFVVAGERYQVIGAPQRNALRLTWACEAAVLP